LDAICPGEAGKDAECRACLKGHKQDASLVAACPHKGTTPDQIYFSVIAEWCAPAIVV